MYLKLKANIIFLFIFLYACTSAQTYNNQNIEQKKDVKIFLSEYNNTSNQSLVLESKEQTKLVYAHIVESDGFEDLNLSKSNVLSLLGSPFIVKTEFNYEIWQYRSSFCNINFIWNNEANNLADIKSYNQDKNNIDYKKCIVYFYMKQG